MFIVKPCLLWNQQSMKNRRIWNILNFSGPCCSSLPSSPAHAGHHLRVPTALLPSPLRCPRNAAGARPCPTRSLLYHRCFRRRQFRRRFSRRACSRWTRATLTKSPPLFNTSKHSKWVCLPVKHIVETFVAFSGICTLWCDTKPDEF